MSPRQHRHVGHAAEEVHAAYCVSRDVRHAADRDRILIVSGIPGAFFVAAVTVPALFEQPAGEFEVLGFARHAVKFRERQFDLFMARYPVAFARAEFIHHVADHAGAHFEQGPVAGSQQVCDAGLDHVSRTVHLVLVHVRPALVESGERVVGIDIAVGLLGRGDFGDPLVGRSPEHRVGVVDQAVRDAFQSLVYVRIVEKDA